jgi:hypothetical protein
MDQLRKINRLGEFTGKVYMVLGVKSAVGIGVPPTGRKISFNGRENKIK